MKKVLLLAAVTALAALGASQALAAKPFAQATGDVTLSTPTQLLSFNAFDYGATGDRGTVSYTNVDAGLTYQADVFCATVSSAGHWANFAYQIPNVDYPGVSGLYVVWHVTDGGSPGAGHDTAGFTAYTDQASATAACNNASFAPDPNAYPVTDGNLVVH
jgi:hypothetical protein